MGMDSAGIDVGSMLLSVTVRRGGKLFRKVFPNTPSGHQAICRFLSSSGRTTRVCVESTGMYGLDLSVALSQGNGIEVMVANPRAVRRFAQALLERNKSDRIDADVLEQFAARMPFQPWRSPSSRAMQLRAIARRLDALTIAAAAEKNHLHAASLSRETPQIIRKDIEQSIGRLKDSIRRLTAQALKIIRADAVLKNRFDLAITVPGIANTSAIRILGELAWLPPDMDARQWVAFAGLDPQHHTSGTTIHKKPRLSKAGNRYLRSAVYMPALAARRHNPTLKAFADHLIARGKTPMQALTALMRKLLVILHAMFRKNQLFSLNPQNS